MAHHEPNARTVLVTGAAGSLAQRVISRLYWKYQVIAVDFRRRVETDADIPSYRVDMQKGGFEEVFRRHKIDAVLHLGRIFAHESTRLRRYNANVLGSRRLLELSRKYGVEQVLIHSTYFVYGASPYNPALLTEDAPLKASEVTADLVDAVELESLAQIWLWKHPELQLTILRPCNVLGPGVRNSMSLLLSRRLAPALFGYSPMMQFLHVDDMADAVVAAFEKKARGVYNVAPKDYVPYQEALRRAGCQRLPIAPIPQALPRLVSHALNWGAFFPPYLINYLKYPVILDGALFEEQFDWRPTRPLAEILDHYRVAKLRGN
ncbi:NAD-dependent epimerase/dehydratase family protein [Algiphilus sp.]|uniref:NAD-dependent epimerase/dehydratase family protein n=1 Tax=Algiphilus sp. TaxID=1872431 RepID=UPI0032EEDF4F